LLKYKLQIAEVQMHILTARHIVFPTSSILSPPRSALKEGKF